MEEKQVSDLFDKIQEIKHDIGNNDDEKLATIEDYLEWAKQFF